MKTKKRLIQLLALVGMMLFCGGYSAWGQTTIGLTQALDDVSMTVGAKTFTPMDNVTIEKSYGTNIKDITNDSKDRFVYNGSDNKYNAKSDCWRKSQNGVYTDQYVGYDLTVASGYALKLSKVDARILVGDNTYNWYVQILDANGGQLYKSEEKTTKTTDVQSVSDPIDLSSLTGKISVRLYVKQSGSTKYFVADKLTLQAEVVADARPTYAVTTSVTPEGAGSVEPSGTVDYVEGSDVVLTAKANEGFKFVKWTVDDADVEGNPYTISAINAAHSAVAMFEALPKITFSAGDDTDVRGKAPAVEYAEVGGQYAVPGCHFLVKDGYTLTGWTDGMTTYAIGDKFTVEGDVTLTPVFTQNTQNLGDADATVNWTFAPDAGAPQLACENSTMYYVQTAKINGVAVDAAMFINTLQDAGIAGSHGKINNTGNTNRAQVNGGTVFTIPAVTNMVVTCTITNGTPTVDAISFDGGNATAVDATARTISYTYTGDADSIRIIDQGKNLYPSGISVFYPASVQTPYTMTTADTDYYSLCLDSEVAIPDGVTAYTGELDAAETTLTLNAVTGGVIPAREAVLVKSAAAGDYVFALSKTDAPKSATNSLKGVTVETPATDLAETGKTVLTLGTLNGVVAFRQPATGKIGANRAYLLVSEASGAKVRIVENGSTTGISEVTGGSEEGNARVYNLAGQRTDASAKGLLIKNGKKYIVK